MTRLNTVAADRGDESPSAIATRLNVSNQMVTNWAARGVSKEGALKAQLAYGCDANWILGLAKQPWPSTRANTVDGRILQRAVYIARRETADRRMTDEQIAAVIGFLYTRLAEGAGVESTRDAVIGMLHAFELGSMTS